MEGSPALVPQQDNKDMMEEDNKDMMDGPLALIPQQKQKQMAEHDRRSIIKVCKEVKDWIDPETGAPYAGFEMGDINKITIKNILNFQNSVIVLDDKGDKFNKDIVYFFTEGRNKKYSNDCNVS